MIRTTARGVLGVTVNLVGALWLLVLLLVVWELVARVLGSLFFPPVSRIVAAFAKNWLSADPSLLFVSDPFRMHVLPSLTRLGIGYTLAVVVGVGAGIILGVWRSAGTFFSPLIRFGFSIPSVALLPIALVIFGINDSMNIFLIALGSLWAVLFNTWDGVRNVDGAWVLAARSMRLSRRSYFFDVLLPAASPSVFTGMRVSLGIGLIAIVVSELYAATNGIGYFLVISQRLFRIDDVWSAMMLLALLGLLFNAIFGIVELRFLRWHAGARASAEYART